MRLFKLFLLVLAAGWLGCGIEDSDRCPSGYVYESSVRLCQKAGVALQQGEACSSSDNRCGLEASYCLADPATGNGYCTKTNCGQQSQCPAGYQCCDCSAITYPVLCARDEEATGALGSLCHCAP